MQSPRVAQPVPLSESRQMPERSAVAERYRPARLTKMPRNRADKKDLDVRIGSANLPVSQPLMLNTESAAFVVGEEEG